MIVELNIKGFTIGNPYHEEIGQAFSQFSEWYKKNYNHEPQFYITRDGDAGTKSHIDLSTSNPARGVSSPIYVLFHFFDYIRLNNLLPDWTVAIANHIKHMHFFKESSQPKGYFVEKENKDPKVPFQYVFDKSEEIIDRTRQEYSAHELDLAKPFPFEEEKKVNPQGSPLKKFNFDNRWIIPILILVAGIFIYFKYFRNSGESQDDSIYGYY